MAPPRTTPVLRDIDADAVAREVVDLCAQHAEQLRMQIAPTEVWPMPPDTGTALGIGATVAYLTVYAKTGVDPEAGDHSTSEQLAAERLADVCGALYSRAVDQSRLEVPELAIEGEDPATPIAVVIVAANARMRLAQGQALSTREVATLASCSARTVRAAAADGALVRGEDWRIPADEARRWLACRGVAV
jgi:hypothetical protein